MKLAGLLTVTLCLILAFLLLANTLYEWLIRSPSDKISHIAAYIQMYCNSNEPRQHDAAPHVYAVPSPAFYARAAKLLVS